MIQRRYPVILGAVAASLLLIAVNAAVNAVELFQRGNDWYLENSGPTVVDQTAVYEIYAGYESMQRIVPWLVLSALIAGIAALALVVLRARDQAGSASASASREASDAVSRS